MLSGNRAGRLHKPVRFVGRGSDGRATADPEMNAALRLDIEKSRVRICNLVERLFPSEVALHTRFLSSVFVRNLVHFRLDPRLGIKSTNSFPKSVHR